MRRLTIAFLAACLMSVSTYPALAQEATPGPTSAVDVSAIDAQTLRALCEMRTTDEAARAGCLDMVDNYLVPLLGLAVQQSGEVAEVQPEQEASGPYGVGDWIVIQQQGADALRLKVTEVKQAASLKAGGFREKPERRGNVLLSAFFRFEGLGATPAVAEPFFAVYVDGEVAQVFRTWAQPEFPGGSLRAGQSSSGWVTYEVPKRGEVIVGNPYLADSPMEIVLREK